MVSESIRRRLGTRVLLPCDDLDHIVLLANCTGRIFELRDDISEYVMNAARSTASASIGQTLRIWRIADAICWDPAGLLASSFATLNLKRPVVWCKVARNWHAGLYEKTLVQKYMGN